MHVLEVLWDAGLGYFCVGLVELWWFFLCWSL